MTTASKKEGAYAHLPKSVLDNKDLGFEKLVGIKKSVRSKSMQTNCNVSKPGVMNFLLLQKPLAGKDDYLTQFLKKTVPERHHSSFTGDADMKYQRISLKGNTKSKPLKDFQRSRSKRKQLTAREKRDLKLFDIKKKEQKYETYLPLHELWKDYMRDLLSLDKMCDAHHADTERKLLKADYSGALMKVSQAKCTSLIGKQGIVLMETKHTFKVITEKNFVKVFPKQHTIFTMELDGYTFTIFGNNFQFKPADRSTRKFKGSLSTAIV